MPQSSTMTRSQNAILPAPTCGAGLRLAMLAPISWRVPPRHYGPWERVVSLLTEGLVGRGVAVTLFATADSITRARLAGSCPRPVDRMVDEYLRLHEEVLRDHRPQATGRSTPLAPMR
jgi:hypothetical protein